MLWHQIFCENILHIYKHVHLLYLYHRLRCTRIYWYTWYTVCLNVNAGFYVEVATCSNFYSLCTLSMINFRHENLAKLRFHQTAQAPQTPPCEGRFSLESKIRVNFSASMDTKGGFVCGPGQQWWTQVYYSCVCVCMHEHQVWSLFRPEIPSSFATGMITHRIIRIQSHRFSNSTFLPRFHCSTSTGAFSSGFSCGALAPQPIACRAALEVDRAG